MQTSLIQQIVRIRDRGQMTIPEKIRKTLTWLQGDSVVEVIADTNTEEIKIKKISNNSSVMGKRNPYKQKMKMSWGKIMKNLDNIRSSGDKKVNLGDFLIKDRDRRKYGF